MTKQIFIETNFFMENSKINVSKFKNQQIDHVFDSIFFFFFLSFIQVGVGYTDFKNTIPRGQVFLVPFYICWSKQIDFCNFSLILGFAVY